MKALAAIVKAFVGLAFAGFGAVAGIAAVERICFFDTTAVADSMAETRLLDTEFHAQLGRVRASMATERTFLLRLAKRLDRLPSEPQTWEISFPDSATMKLFLQIQQE